MKEIILKGIIGWDITAEDIRKQLPQGSEKIRLLINSEGGNIFESFEIYNLLKEYPGKITARITGIAASAAADIFFGADDREWFSHSAIMNHKAWTIAVGNADDLQKEVDILNGMDNIRVRDYAKITGKTFDDAMAEFKNELWFIGDEQIRNGGITGILVDGEEPEPVTEPVARQRVANAVKVLKEAQELKDFSAFSREKIAALLKMETPAPAAEKNNQGDVNMDFKKFLAENPEAEPDVLAYAKTKIGPGTEETKKAESDRILEIMALAGIQISDSIKAKITAGETPEAFAVAALKEQRAIEAKLREAGGPNPVPGTVAQLPGQQGLQGKPQGKEPELATAENIAEIAASVGGR